MILGILQARVLSRRLSQKVLLPIQGHAMLWHVVKRLQRSRKIDQLVIATSNQPEDAPIEKLGTSMNVPVYRGDLNNVLDRFYKAALPYNPDMVVRLTADCPLIDPNITDKTVEFYLSNDFDYVSNSLEPTFPDGLDTEVFSFDSLKIAWQEAKLKSEQEHVTPFFYNNPKRFKVGIYKNETDLSHMRWTVDEPADLEFVKKIYENLYPKNPQFTYQDVLRLLQENKDLENLNKGIGRNEGYLKSVRDERA